MKMQLGSKLFWKEVKNVKNQGRNDCEEYKRPAWEIVKDSGRG